MNSSSSSSPAAAGSSSTAAPLPPKDIYPIGGPPSRSSSQRSSSSRTRASRPSIPSRDASRPSGHVPTASEAEARLDARLGGGVNRPNNDGAPSAATATAAAPLPPVPAASSSPSPRRRAFAPRALRLAASHLPRLPVRVSSLPTPSLPGSDTSSTRSGPKKPASRVSRVAPALIVWLISLFLLAGTGIGYSVAIRMTEERAKQQAANPQPEVDDSNGDPTDGMSSTAFLHTFFLMGLVFELCFLYRRTRALVIAACFDPFYYYSPAAISSSTSSTTRRDRPASHPRADNPNPSADELKNSVARKWAKRALFWVMRIRESQLRPREESLPTYGAALEVPCAWEEEGGDALRGRLTREERRRARTGSARGTGDVEDIEVERAWRLGGGRGPPAYGGDEVRHSVILLSGPAATYFPTDPAHAAHQQRGSNPPLTPRTPGTPGSFTRISRRVSDSVGRLSRRISAGLGMGSPALAPAASPKLAPPEKRDEEGMVPSPVRRAHHASVCLDLAHEFEVEADEKEALDSPGTRSRRTSNAPSAGPSGAQYASYTPRSSVVLDQHPGSAAVASPRRTSWTLAHHRRRSSASSAAGHTAIAVPPSPAPQTSRLATVQEGDGTGRPSTSADNEDQEEVVV